MAKDGTNRGGRRVGAGRKPKALKDKLLEGNVGHRPIKTLTFDGMDEVDMEMPTPNELLSEVQRDGSKLQAKAIYEETWNWLKERNCVTLVSPQMIERYAMSAARWIQVESLISQSAFWARHPTTGVPIASPLVNISATYMSQTERLWATIYEVVRENCSSDYEGANPQENVMEQLLKAHQGM